MSFRKFLVILSSGLFLFFLASFAIFWPNTNAQAQCGSQASSCKNCHEVQAQDPVNNDGTGWHESHAFGDFCYICHAGNNQSMDKDTAHTGMVPPLSDIKDGCQSCHPNDLTERAQVYASALGISLEGGGAPGAVAPAAPTGQGPTPTAGQAGETAASVTGSQPSTSGGDSASTASTVSGEIVNYNQRYEELATGKRLINWGNVILSVLIFALVVGGGAFVYANERKLRGLPGLKHRAASSQPAAHAAPIIEGYSAEVTALLPKIARLNPAGLHALHRLLENPDTANDLFHSLSKLDPELVNRVRNLDRSTRELLLAMSGD